MKISDIKSGDLKKAATKFSKAAVGYGMTFINGFVPTKKVDAPKGMTKSYSRQEYFGCE